ncbi:MAG: hypothetical protein OXI16_08035 [Chloroflexota bacterium]|nr:hypothetical protein [Chloroflexota bacterium]
MLSGFRRPAADFRVELSKTTLRPGDKLKIRVSIVPREDFQARRGRVEIVGAETYVDEIRTRQTTRHGPRRYGETRILSRYEKVFVGVSAMRRGLSYSFDVDWQVPLNAPPTARGVRIDSIDVGIVWSVATSMDVADAGDFHDDQEITVVAPRSIGRELSSPLVAQNADDRCALTLTLPRRNARSGQTVDGILRAEISQDMRVSEVRAELIRVEAFGPYVVEKEYRGGRVKIDGNLALRRGETREWHFQLETGDVYAPTLRTDYSSVKWLIKCVLARRMRFDSQVGGEIWVGV